MKDITCQMTMSDGGSSATGTENFWRCGRPAVAWIVDQFKRTGWNGRQHLCKMHVRHYNNKAQRLGRPLANEL